MVVLIEVYAAGDAVAIILLANNYIAGSICLIPALGEIIFNFATSSKCAAVYIDSFLELLVVLSLVFFICSTSIIRLVVVEAADIIFNLAVKLYIVDSKITPSSISPVMVPVVSSVTLTPSAYGPFA